LPVTTTPVTVAEYMQSWLTATMPARVATERLAPSTVDSYTDNTRKHIVPELFCTPGLGLRHGEALGLQWAGIDFEQQTVKISRSLQRLRGPKDPDMGKHRDKLASPARRQKRVPRRWHCHNSPRMPCMTTDSYSLQRDAADRLDSLLGAAKGVHRSVSGRCHEDR
jgi:integrase